MKTSGKRRINGLLVGVAVTLIGAAYSGTPAYAEEGGTEVGTLNCNVAGGWGYILGSTKKLHCTFTPSGGGEPELYTGSITKMGADIGYTKSGILVWGVIAPTTNLQPGALAGKYGGVSAEVTAGAGPGANVLVGGGNSVSLQPISIGGQEGLNVAGGIGGVTLEYVK